MNLSGRGRRAADDVSTPFSATGAVAPIRCRGAVYDTGAVDVRRRGARAASRVDRVWEWLRRRRASTGRTLRLRSRGEVDGITRVDFAELAPDLDTFIGQVAYLQLGYFETLSELIASTPELERKEALARAAGGALRRHEELVALIRERGDEPTALMLPFREPLDAFRAATHGMRPPETMLSVYLISGMLDDFALALSASYGETGRRVARILGTGGADERSAIVGIITETIADDAEWSSLLAMWGRRLVGDTLLTARHALRRSDDASAVDAKVEPVFTQLLAAHARRMGSMGLSS